MNPVLELFLAFWWTVGLIMSLVTGVCFLTAPLVNSDIQPVFPLAGFLLLLCSLVCGLGLYSLPH